MLGSQLTLAKWEEKCAIFFHAIKWSYEEKSICDKFPLEINTGSSRESRNNIFCQTYATKNSLVIPSTT